ncbi:MAG: ABC transporter ATP-binding protein [Clostridiales Family XIII bacterium]|nr:ABC transporter ATP-binding protein [Clostridiales Family XIII bacterium]
MNAMIEVKELTKQYNKAKVPAVDHIDFSVEKGEFFAFLGPNGAGKTTTISILTTTLSKTSGSVLIAGYDAEKEARRVREKVGIIFQEPSLDPQLSAEENIRFHACLYGMVSYRPTFRMMPAAYRNRVLELAEIVGIQDALFKPIKKLSGGMRRKLEIIRSLIHTPDVLFLDEPSSGLDAVSRRSLWEYIDASRRANGTTVFLTTHYIDEAELVDKVCIINKGKIGIAGPPEEMKENLLKRELVLDAEDRGKLISELSHMGLTPQIGKHLIVPTGSRSAQEIIAGIGSKLTVLNVTEPSLEDAYVEYLIQEGGVAA